jgi:site-specific DNA recombinase
MIKEEMKVNIYIRVSTARQAKEGDSLDEQETELKKFCEYRGFQIRNIYIEPGRSGGTANRPKYQKLLKDIKANRVNAVVVKKIDRLSRSLLDFESFMRLAQEHNVEFISIKESFDTTSAMGKAMLRIAMIFAQLEREQTSERVTDTMTYRASQGLFNGGIPSYGYTNANKELIPYPKERQIVELIFEQFLNNKSTTQTARTLNETGYRHRTGKLWGKYQVQRILQNPIYKGMVFWNDKLYQGIHQPIISEKRFNEAKLIFEERLRIKPNSKTNALLQKLLFCGHCKSIMTTTYGINKQKTKYYYYNCTSTKSQKKTQIECELKYISFKKAETKLIALLLSLSEQKYFITIENSVLKHNQKQDQQIQKVQAEINALETKIQTTKTKKDHYLDSLILGNFRASEREKINNRIEEMELEEKQIKALLYKQQFKLTQTQQEKINLTALKKTLIEFKADHETLSHEQTKEYLVKNIEKIFYFPNKLAIKLKAIPWFLDFDTKTEE